MPFKAKQKWITDQGDIRTVLEVTEDGFILHKGPSDRHHFITPIPMWESAAKHGWLTLHEDVPDAD